MIIVQGLKSTSVQYAKNEVMTALHNHIYRLERGYGKEQDAMTTLEHKQVIDAFKQQANRVANLFGFDPAYSV